MLEKMFNYENPFWQAMTRIADILILNLVVIVFSLPIFTIGASWTAMYYTLLKIVRKEDTYILKEFWHSFKTNFKQATKIWLILLPIIIFLVLDFSLWFYNVSEGNTEVLPGALKVTTIIVAVVILIELIYVFPILSHFENTTKKTLINAFMVSILNIPYTIYFIIVLAIPVVLMLVSSGMFIVVLMFGIAGPAFLCTLAWDRIFKKLEPHEDDDEDEDEDEEDEDKIFSDHTEDEGAETEQHLVLDGDSNQHIRLE